MKLDPETIMELRNAITHYLEMFNEDIGIGECEQLSNLEKYLYECGTEAKEISISAI